MREVTIKTEAYFLEEIDQDFDIELVCDGKPSANKLFATVRGMDAVITGIRLAEEAFAKTLETSACTVLARGRNTGSDYYLDGECRLQPVG